MNFLEELAAEWYEFNGYFTRTNIKWGKRPRGGWTGEIDVLAYLPSTCELIHIETSGSADSLSKQRDRFLTQKFNVTEETYSDIVGGPIKTLRKIAIASHVRKPKSLGGDWGEVEPITIHKFIDLVAKSIWEIKPKEEAISEAYPLLRAFQSALMSEICRKGKGGD